MKQTKIEGYQPGYPKKLIKGAALTAAALVAMSGAACSVRTGGVALPEPTPEELVIDGDVAIETPDPEMPGEPTVDENGDDVSGEETSGRQGPELQGKIVVDDTPNP